MTNLPTLPPDLAASILDAANDSTDLISDLDGLPVIGQFLGVTYSAKSPDLALAHAMFERFPLLYHNLALTIFSLTGKPAAYPRDLAPPAICLARAVPNIPSIYVDLISGEATFDVPAGPCAQFKMQPTSSSAILYS